MPVMSAIESRFCRSAPWEWFARRTVLPWALDGHQLTGDVLEIGAGGGAMADGVARKFPTARLTVTDVDDAMVAAARARLVNHQSVAVQRADTTALGFEDASFDAVTTYLMLHHVIAWQEALAEALRVLRPGGTFIGYDLTDTRIARLVHRADGSPHQIIAMGEMRDRLAAAGFVGISVRTSAGSHLMRFHNAAGRPMAVVADVFGGAVRRVTGDGVATTMRDVVSQRQ
jgi:SAM-dependent methyltransferase